MLISSTNVIIMNYKNSILPQSGVAFELITADRISVVTYRMDDRRNILKQHV